MPIDRTRYPKNWDEIALAVKQQANWQCQHCKIQCLKPDSDSKSLSRADKARLTLTVHHANYCPEDNCLENLIPLCASCHLAMHRGGRKNVSPGQLSFIEKLLE